MLEYNFRYCCPTAAQTFLSSSFDKWTLRSSDLTALPCSDNSQLVSRRLSSPDPPGLVVFDDSLERRPRNSSEDGLLLHPPASLFEAWGTGLLDMLYLGP